MALLARSIHRLAVRSAVGPAYRSLSSIAGRLPVTSLTEDEQMLQEAVKKWATTSLSPRVRDMDEKGEMDSNLIKEMFDNGFMGVEIPEKYDGTGSNFFSACLVVEELAKIDPSFSVMADVHNTLINNMFQFWASDMLKEKYLPRLATSSLGAFCLSEAGSGSDAFAMTTRANKSADGSYYTISGSKMWITNAPHADVFLVMANVDPSKGYKGITCFVVDRDAEGLEIGHPEKKLGLKASGTCQLNFNDVKIKSDHILGDIGRGYKYAIEILNEGRIGIGAQQVGIAQGCFDVTLPYLFQRKQFGKAVGDFQGLQHQYAQIATEIEAARLLVYNAARMKEAGIPFVKEAAMAKLYASQIAAKTTTLCIDWLGGVGFTQDFPAEKFYRDCKVGTIYEGTSNIQLNTIAKLLKPDYT